MFAAVEAKKVPPPTPTRRESIGKADSRAPPLAGDAAANGCVDVCVFKFTMRLTYLGHGIYCPCIYGSPTFRIFFFFAIYII